MIKEIQLHSFWKYHARAIRDFKSIDGKQISILDEGSYNTNQGPDFLNAFVDMDGVRWFGNIEMHVKTSDWFLHHHQCDINFKPIILHVVWENDSDQYHHSPVIELRQILQISRLDNYDLCKSNLGLACSNVIGASPGFMDYLDEHSFNRINERTSQMIDQFIQFKSWNEICWIRLSRLLGGVQNGDAFGLLANSIPYPILCLVRFDFHQLNALIRGQSGLLGISGSAERHNLIATHASLQQKFGLNRPQLQFTYLRMRPSSFPDSRLTYLIKLLYDYPQFIDRLSEISSREEWSVFVRTYGYSLSKMLLNSILINLVIPMCYAKQIHLGKVDAGIQFISWMRSIAPEHNSIVKRFENRGVSINSAYQTQGVLELYAKKCVKNSCRGCPRNLTKAN